MQVTTPAFPLPCTPFGEGEIRNPFYFRFDIYTLKDTLIPKKRKLKARNSMEVTNPPILPAMHPLGGVEIESEVHPVYGTLFLAAWGVTPTPLEIQFFF